MTHPRPAMLLLAAALLIGCEHQTPAPTPAATTASADGAAAPAADKPADPATPWSSLFDGKTLAGWEVTQFGTQGEVEVKDGAIIVNLGDGLGGVHYAKPETLPKIDYEITVEAMRVDGADFFCGLTFPYNDSAATLVCGGWGGALVGISSIDGQDAAHNETSSTFGFEDNKWYTIRLRATNEKIQAWIDKEQVVDVEVKGRKVSPRGDIELAAPLGLSTWTTTGAFRNVKIRKLAPGEK